MEDFHIWFSEHEYKIEPAPPSPSGRILRLNPNFEDVDLNSDRPFIQWQNASLIDLVNEALNRPWQAIEIATLALDEAKKRNRVKTFEKIKAAFSKSGVMPIPWLDDARITIKNLTNSFEKPKSGMSSVYFILVSGFSEQNGTYGCYVGQTSTTKLHPFRDRVTKRISQHFDGVKSARGLQKRGIEPLWSLNFFTGTLRAKNIQEKETSCNVALQNLNIKTKGDLLIDD